MKKIYNLTNSHHKEGQEKSIKIYRSISDYVKRLDDARGCASKISDLFTPSTQIQRSKLQDYCERLIINNPLAYGLKIEELLWRKAYYDIISTAKRLKKQEYTNEEKSNLIAHINAGIGHYHHYISRLQTEFNLTLEGNLDFFLFDRENDKNINEELRAWALKSVHRSLIYLGDLSRYKLEIYPNWDPNLAIRYYSQALLLKPEYGMPHNQMGTLATSLNQHLDATYHYIQCMMCKNSFEGTENNLHRLFERNSQYLEQLPIENPDADCIIQLEQSEQIKRFIARFLLLTDVWFFNKKIPHVYDLCHQTNVDLQECLSFLKQVASETSGSQNGDCNDTDSIISPSSLSADMTFKIIVICLLCITKLQKDNSHQHSNVIAFTLAVYSQLVQHVFTHIQESILNFPVSEKKINRIKKMEKKCARRRKKLSISSDDDDEQLDAAEGSELSESESDSDCSSGVLESSSEDECTKNEEKVIQVTQSKETDKELQTAKEIAKKVKLMDIKDLVDIISDEIYLQSVKILSDWLSSDAEILKSCARTTQSLFHQVIKLLNLINIDFKRIKIIDNIAPRQVLSDGEKMPLDEDFLLKDLPVLKESQKNLTWNYFSSSSLSKKDEVLVRVRKLILFGNFLASNGETGVHYDAKTKEFSIDLKPEQEQDPIYNVDALAALEAENNGGGKTSNNHQDRGELMKNMGQLWLAAEVKDLESRVKGKMSLSPYLVIDVEALIKHFDMVKHLVYARKFLILVPSAVLCALDDLKKVKLEAREAIRWLESQFRKGNRFFRPQRAQERLPIPFIKYPKRKDKESNIYIQIIECCHYLAEQQKRATNLVTLLMGDPNALHNTENREISYVGLAQSAGVNLELITEFYAKWKKSAKGKR